MKKRIVSILLALAMLAGIGGAVSVSARAEGAAAAEARLPAKKELSAQWFKKRPSDEFNRDIALMAAALVKDETEFKNRYGAPGKPLELERFSAGTFIFGVENPAWKIGSVELGDTTLVVVKLDGAGAFGSGQYAVSNFIGYYGYAVKSEAYGGCRVAAGHRSYADAVWEALSGLKNRFDGKKNLKLLITGHSMGASCANLLGVRLEEEGQICGRKIGGEDIYVYTFEALGVYLDPLSPFSGAKYGNIMNLVNAVDIAVLFMPGQRFGKTYMFNCPDPENDRHNLSFQEYRDGINGVDPADNTQRLWPGNLFAYGALSLAAAF